MRDDIRKFLIIYAECFIIIFVMGGVLPGYIRSCAKSFLQSAWDL